MEQLLQGLTLLSVLGLVFVNGWTDTPNCIATVVGTGALSYRRAVAASVFFHLVGIFVMAFYNSSVTDTILGLVNLQGQSVSRACAAICGAMFAAVLFSLGSWFFSVPTSESHGLIAGLAGAGIALGGGLRSTFFACNKVLAGLLISVAAAFAAGILLTWLFQKLARRWNERRFCKLEIFSSCCMSFMHGAQDGLKFLGVFVLVQLLTQGVLSTGPVQLSGHVGAMLLCAGTMGLGTACGGRKIVRKLGSEMAGLSAYQGFCSDLACAACLLFSSLSGIPLSTTHTKVTAMVGAAAALKSRIDLGVVGHIVWGWVFTFPVCGALAYLLTKGFLSVLC